MLNTRFAAFAVVFAASAFAQAPAEFGMGWVPEFHASTKELVSLAEATPAEKFAWRPAQGVRSISEVYVHIAVAHMFFLTTCGVKADMSKVTRDAEKKITSKADVIAFLKESIAAVDENYPKLDMHKKVKFTGADTTVEGIMVHLISHTNEHLGQSIAYARMNGIVPPWSN
ncbi:MAG: DinB family protein [Acidobacteriia bacterium]|nr:DinB family protein [Terriglobia bacterium]